MVIKNIKIMREIKFRAFDDGQIINCPIGTNYGLHRFFGILSDEAILMQYTGLEDKNGVEIYGGDIISIYSPCIDKTLPWKEPRYAVMGWHKKGCWNLFKTDYSDSGIIGITLSILQYCTIIGNIHENPELLNK